MSILFSPVGTADPITSLGDGPMLHMVRHLKPDRVVLFLTPKMQEIEDEDNRFTRAIEWLYKGVDDDPPTIEIVRSNNNAVYRFDTYIGEFESILRRLCADSPNEPVMANASSGTPGMQQALVALGSFGRLRLDMYQIPTPRGGINRRNDREDPDSYDLGFMWELNEELRNHKDPKISKDARKWRGGGPIETPQFANRLLRENVIKLVNGYDYKAAHEMASQMTSIDDRAKEMVEAAADRLNLVGTLPARAFAGTGLAYRANDPLGEYISVMEVRLEQGNWADFVRMLTPALTRIAKNALRDSGVPERSYLINPPDGPELNWNAIERNPQLYRILGPRPNGYRSISNGQLAKMVEDLCPDGREKDMILELRTFEFNCRNRLAHELHASGRGTLERLGGLGLDIVLDYLFLLHTSARRGLFAGINQAIIDRLLG